MGDKMRRISLCRFLLSVLASLVLSLSAQAQSVSAQTPKWPATTEGDYIAKNFKFRSGETLPELRLHYTTLGKAARDAQGRVTNAVLILHGTGGMGHQFLNQIFAGELFNPGQLLDASRYFIILPDGIGHGKSSKPSDGMRAHFPPYDSSAAHRRPGSESPAAGSRNVHGLHALFCLGRDLS